MGGPAVPNASLSAERVTSQVTSVSGKASNVSPSQLATWRPVGPSASMRAMTRAVFSAASSVRIERSSSGSRPTSDNVATKCPRSEPSAASPTCAISASTPATARAVDSTRCAAGPTKRTENWRGSDGASNSLPRFTSA